MTSRIGSYTYTTGPGTNVTSTRVWNSIYSNGTVGNSSYSTTTSGIGNYDYTSGRVGSTRINATSQRIGQTTYTSVRPRIRR